MISKCGNAEDIEETQKDRRKNAPRQLPRTRPRTLTCPLGGPGSRPSWNPFKRAISQQTLDQSQSQLLRLPKEILDLIFAQILGGHLLHIARARKKLVAISCTDKSRGGRPYLETSGHNCWGSTTGWPQLGTTPGYLVQTRDDHPPARDLLPLLQTCRMVYTQTIRILYRDNIFDINHLDTVMYMDRSILPQRLSQIRKLNFTWDFKGVVPANRAPYDLGTWRETCQTLSTSFHGLHELTMYLTGSSGALTRRNEWRPLLDAMKQIKALSFTVFLQWSEDECMKAAREDVYPFRLVPWIVLPPLEHEVLEGDNIML